MIALPEVLREKDPDELLRLFTEAFREKYGVYCVSALHHNRDMTNYHIHLIYSERKLKDRVEEKVASRNMFYDETGRHVRTKKEILDADGKIRPGWQDRQRRSARKTVKDRERMPERSRRNSR